MRYITAYALCQLGGNPTPTAEDLSSVISAAGGQAEADVLAHFISLMSGNSYESLVVKGASLLSSVGVSASAAPAQPAAVEEKKTETAKKEEAKKPEPEEDSESDFMDIFG